MGRNPHEIRAIGLLTHKNSSFDWYRKVGRVTAAMSVISLGTAQRGQEGVWSVDTSFESDGLNLIVDEKSGVQPPLRSHNVTSPDRRQH